MFHLLMKISKITRDNALMLVSLLCLGGLCHNVSLGATAVYKDYGESGQFAVIFLPEVINTK